MMSDATAVRAEPVPTEIPEGGHEQAEVVIEDLLVEDVSIDGMCGVY